MKFPKNENIPLRTNEIPPKITSTRTKEVPQGEG
jgi:hypothetical protein